jgi:ankyrin repeat protein
LEVLLAAGASIAKTLPDGSTPLHTAAIGGDDHAVDLLCTAGASVVALNNAKRTPLHNCGITGNTKVGAALLQKGADVDALDDEGATPLLRAAMGSNADMARLLVQNGANVEHVMGTGTSLRSPLSIAATNGYVDVVRVLIKAGADPKATLGGETTVLALTKQAKQHSAAGILMNALKRKKAAEKQINEPVKQVDAFAPLPKSKPRIDSANVNEDEPTSKMRASVNELGVICPSLRYDEHEHGKKLSKVFSKARAEWVKSKNDPSSPHYTKACKLLTEWFLFEYRVRSGFSISLGFNDDNEIDRVDEVGEVKDASEAVEAAFREPPVLKSFEIIWVDFRSSTSTLPLQDSDSLHQSPEVGAIAVYQIKPKRNLSSPRLLSEFLTGPGQQVAECFAFQIKDALIETVDTNEDGDEYTSSSSTYAGGDIELIVNAYTGKGFRDQLVQAVRDYHKHSSLIGEETPEIKRVMLLGDEGRLRQILDEGLPVETMVEDQTLLKLVLMMAVTAPNWYTHLELSDTLKQSFADENEYREALKRMALELLDRGANIDTTPGPASIMTLAELLEDQTILQICRERTQSGADADALSLLVAAEKGNAASLQALVGRGARVNKRDAFRGITPLMIASQGAGGEDAPPVTGSKMLSQLEAVRYLIDQGARLDAKANNGDTAIGNAVRRGNIEIVKLLLDAGAKTDEALPRNQSLIDLAKERGHVEVLKLLQEHSGKHVGEPSTDGSNDMPLAGRFCLPFDVDAFAEYFPPEWTLVEEMDNETRTLLEGPSGDRIAVGSHQLKPSSDLFDVVGKYAGYFDENEGVEAFTSSIGTQGWSVKVRSGDKSNVMLELWGPALMSVRFVYEATSIDAATKVVLHKAVTNLIWLNGSVSCADALPVKTIKDLQHHIRAVLKDHEGLRDEILSSFADDDNVMLYPHEIEAVAEQGPSTYPLVRALVRYAIVHGIKVDVGDLCKLQSWCGAHFLNDPDLKQLLAGSAQGAAKSTRDFLEIATVARASGDCEREESLIQAALEAAKSTDDHIKLASHPLIATDPARVHSLLDAALAVATDVGDLREVLNHDLAGSDLLRLVLDRLRTSSADETFLSSVWNPLDVLILACDKSLMDRAAVEVEILALADLSPILSDAPKQATVQALPVDDETDEGNRLFQLPDMEESRPGTSNGAVCVKCC